MVANIVSGVWMNQRRQGTPVDYQPGYESSELLWGEEIHLKHANGVGTDGSVKDGIDAKFGDFGTNISILDKSQDEHG